MMCAVMLGAAGCGGAARSTNPTYRAVATVLESTGRVGSAHGPQLCLGGIRESLPPQCGGPDLVGWNWDAVDGDTTIAGTSWGDYVVVGTFDGTRFALTASPRPATPDDRPSDDPQPDFSTRCPEPTEGWVPRVIGNAQDDLLDAAATRYLEDAEISAVWVDQTDTRLVWNVRVTRDPGRHRRALEPLMPPNLCVTEGGRSRNGLNEIAKAEVAAVSLANRLGGGALEVAGTVEVRVALDRDAILQQSLDAKYGAGLVQVRSALTPIS